MRRDFRNRYYPGEHDPDHINWEKKMTSGNGTRGKKRDACRSSKSGKERAARRQQEEEQRLAGTASPAVNNSAPAGNSRARSPTTRARGRSPTVARSPTTRARGRGTPAMRSPIRSQSKPRHTRMPTGPRKAFGRPRRFRRRP
ncbi:hypothetical protein GQ42DRAFT_177698 [Ramicandelaber brevisporus]|nr:hypothetical protein GQ42DRAFT_177698 [Ramicandelaber brevisporus]